MFRFDRWAPYVPVAKRRAQAQKKMASLQKKGAKIEPIEIEGRKIARTFWGEGWCDHLESFSDYSNRLPRGRTYVRNGSVCHLAIKQGQVEAKVAGSAIYEVRVKIDTLSAAQWKTIKKQCSGQIGSLLELLQGKLSDQIMSVVTDQKTGLFPKSAEIKFSCDCPDNASMCKHIAAVIYGIGARLDNDPSLLFLLRGVNHEELIDTQVAVPSGTGKGKSKRLATDSLSDVFGIELDVESDSSQPRKKKASSTSRPAKSKPNKKKAAVKKQTEKRTTKLAAKKTSSSAKTSKPKPRKATRTSAKKTTTKQPARTGATRGSRATATNSVRSST